MIDLRKADITRFYYDIVLCTCQGVSIYVYFNLKNRQLRYGSFWSAQVIFSACKDEKMRYDLHDVLHINARRAGHDIIYYTFVYLIYNELCLGL